MISGAGLSFGDFTLDGSSGHLYRGDVVVPLTPKAFAVLDYLAANAGRLVAKQELLDAVWPGVFVGDAVLKVAVREIRRALGDDSHAPRFIETAHRRGYRFMAAVSTPAAAPAAAAIPRVSYARSGNVNIAYQVVGSGPVDLVFVMGWVSHLEYFWNEPSFARFLTRLASMARLILFDKRGTGLSDAVPVDQLPTLEQRLDDVRAVMEAAGSARAVLLGVSEGGPLCSLFAATYPERTEGLIMIGSYARRLRDADYPWGSTREDRDAFCRTVLETWGGPVGIEDRAPSRAEDAAFREWWASYLRMGASPGAAVALTRMNAEIDVRDVLPSIRVPTLVLHRTGDRCLRVDEGRYLASRIPGAAFVELPGDDHLPFVGDQEGLLSEIERFMSAMTAAGGSAHRPASGERGESRGLLSILTLRCDVTGTDRGHVGHVFTREVAWSRGRALRDEPGLLSAAFDGPGRAVSCGRAVAAVASRSGIAVRAGVHIGECDVAAPSGSVPAVSEALAQAASPAEVRVSRTVVDLVPGSGLEFEECGMLGVAGHPRELSMFVLAGAAVAP